MKVNSASYCFCTSYRLAKAQTEKERVTNSEYETVHIGLLGPDGSNAVLLDFELLPTRSFKPGCF